MIVRERCDTVTYRVSVCALSVCVCLVMTVERRYGECLGV